MFEITKGYLPKYDIAKVIMKPPIDKKDVMDIEMWLLSKELPGLIKVHLTIDRRNSYNPRSYTNNEISLSACAKRELRVLTRQLAVQLHGELSDG